MLSLFYGVFHEEYNLSEEYSVQCKVCTVQGIAHRVQNSSFCCPYSCIACFISAIDFSAHSVPDVLIRGCQSYERIFFCGGSVWLVWFGFRLVSFFLFFLFVYFSPSLNEISNLAGVVAVMTLDSCYYY